MLRAAMMGTSWPTLIHQRRRRRPVLIEPVEGGQGDQGGTPDARYRRGGDDRGGGVRPRREDEANGRCGGCLPPPP